MEVIIGKEGNQKFKITNGCVSRKHCKITVDDHNRWILEDLDSTNGTFIQNSEGEFIKVKKMEINEFTRIAIGSTVATGYYFYAHHILEPADNYEAEMRHVLEQSKKLQEEKEQIEADIARKNKIQMVWSALVPVVLLGIALILFREDIRTVVACGGPVVAAVVGVVKIFQSKSGKVIKALAEKQGKIIRCPKCNRQLSPSELASEQCIACKTHS